MFFSRKRSCCPACEKPLIVLELEGVEIDYCAQCRGAWLDAGELEMIGESAGAQPGGLTDALAKAGKGAVAGGRRCPRCLKKLRAIRVGDGPPVEIDRCPRGHGLWFDAGEMRTLVAAFEEGEEGAVARFFSEMYASEIQKESR
jgi:hypothetical protein